MNSWEENFNGKSDPEVWNALKDGDEHAFRYIYQTYVPSLFRYARQFCDDVESIKDCIHDLFVKLHYKREFLPPVKNVKLYLFISLKNMLLNVQKRNKTMQMHIDQFGKEGELLDNGSSPREEEEASAKRVADMLALLTDRQREIIHCRFVEGLSIADISELMHMNTQSVSNLIHRAITRLKKEIKK